MRPLRIGIPVLGGPHWMAGVTYVEMLARSVHALGPSLGIELHLVVRPGDPPDGGLHRPFLGLFRSVLVLDGAAPDPAAFAGAALVPCRGLDGLFSRVDFLYPLNSEAWPDRCAVSWIPDFQHRHLPELFTAEDRADRDARFARVAASARVVAFSSESALRDFRAFHPGSPARARVLSFFAYNDPSAFAADAAAAARRLGLPERFLLCCNQFWVHKDHLTLFRALAELRRRGRVIPLVCTGSAADYRARDHFEGLQRALVSLGIGDQVRILGLLPREEQLQVMRASCALAQPSRFEGWSSIVEDAKALGKTLFLTDLPVHREQAPPDSHYFRPGDAPDLARVLEERFPSLPPGPDPARESRARAAMPARMRDFGAAFLALADETLRAHGQVAGPGSMVDRAETAVAAGDLEAGAALLAALLPGHPERARILNDLGAIHCARGEGGPARERFRESMEADPGSPDPVLNLGQVLCDEGRHGEARRLYAGFLERHPGDAQVRGALAGLADGAADPAGEEGNPSTREGRPSGPAAAGGGAEVVAEVPVAGAARAGTDGLLPARFRVTAIVSAYKAEAHMRGCLQDLVDQTLFRRGEMEVVVVDSGSPEDERRIVAEFQARHPAIVYVRSARETIYGAWNRGALASRSPYLVNANADDRHRADAFEEMAASLDARPEGLVYVDALLTRRENETFASHTADRAWAFPDFSKRQVLVDCPFGCTVMWRRALHARHGLFGEQYHSAGDYEFFMKLGLAEGAYHLRKALTLYYENDSSLSYGNQARALREYDTFLPRLRRDTPLEEIYPFLKDDPSPEARACAAMDFGVLLLHHLLVAGPREAEARFLEVESLLGRRPETMNNLAVAYHMQKRNEDARRLMEELTTAYPQVKGVLGVNNKVMSNMLFRMPHPGLKAMTPVIYPSQMRIPLDRYVEGEDPVRLRPRE